MSTERSLGSVIKSRRLALSLTLDDLASACGCNRSYLSKIESSKCVPKPERLYPICDRLDIDYLQAAELRRSALQIRQVRSASDTKASGRQVIAVNSSSHVNQLGNDASLTKSSVSSYTNRVVDSTFQHIGLTSLTRLNPENSSSDVASAYADIALSFVKLGQAYYAAKSIEAAVISFRTAETICIRAKLTDLLREVQYKLARTYQTMSWDASIPDEEVVVYLYRCADLLNDVLSGLSAIERTTDKQQELHAAVLAVSANIYSTLCRRVEYERVDDHHAREAMRRKAAFFGDIRANHRAAADRYYGMWITSIRDRLTLDVLNFDLRGHLSRAMYLRALNLRGDAQDRQFGASAANVHDPSKQLMLLSSAAMHIDALEILRNLILESEGLSDRQLLVRRLARMHFECGTTFAFVLHSDAPLHFMWHRHISSLLDPMPNDEFPRPPEYDSNRMDISVRNQYSIGDLELAAAKVTEGLKTTNMEFLDYPVSLVVFTPSGQ